MALRSAAIPVLLCFAFGSRLQPVAAQTSSSNDRLEALYAQAKSSESAGDIAKAIDAYQQMLKLDPHLGVAYNNLGAVYFKQGNYHDAAAILERGLKVDPKMTSAAALLGMSWYRLGEYQKARPRLEAVVAKNSSDHNAAMLLVNDLTKLGDFEAAVGLLQKLAKQEPQNQQIWYLLGKVYMQLSEQALGKINQIDPDSIWAHQISAELMESMKNYDGAIVEWKKAISVAPRQPGLHYKLGDLYWSLSQWDNASEQFQQESELDPRNCQVPWKLGDIALQKNADFEAALQKEDEAIAACPDLTEAHTDRARLLLKLHREQEAIPELQAVEKSDPSEPTTHFLLAQAYRASGKSAEAQAEMKSFSELDAKSRAATADRAQEVIKNSQSAH